MAHRGLLGGGRRGLRLLFLIVQLVKGWVLPTSWGGHCFGQVEVFFWCSGRGDRGGVLTVVFLFLLFCSFRNGVRDGMKREVVGKFSG